MTDTNTAEKTEDKELTPAEFLALTPVTMHEDVQAHLESYLGGGTVSINS